MKRVFTRLATLALALPLAAAAAAPAQGAEYSATVPGCYGVGTAIYCNVTATVRTPDAAFSPYYVKVCVGTCHDIPVTYVSTSGYTNVCISYTDAWGTTRSTCTRTLLAADEAVEINDDFDSALLAALTCGTNLLCVHE